ncbi:MAG TPA: Hsp70 family protein [Kofleriaceae bacterium]|nr:Hsp70 family protein [Kofleriaceae bacterium]
MKHSFVGIDFGTTNSAVAVAGADGPARLTPLPGPGGEAATTWRTVLFFEPGAAARGGAPAIERYLECEGDGRLVQSIKSHLSSATFSRTQIAGRTYALEELVALFLRQLRAAAAAAGDDLGERAVIGRPVRYWGAQGPEDEERALARMRVAVKAAGFADVVFEYEPAAAAARYAESLDHDETVLVADFGGGTSDFTLVRLGPGRVIGEPGTVLGTGGVGIGGDSFDARVIDAVVAPALGRGTSYRDEMGAVTEVPLWPYSKLRRWHHLSFLKAPETMRLLERVARGALEPERYGRLVRTVEDDLGLPMHQAVERVKIALSRAGGAGVAGDLEIDQLEVSARVERSSFEAWIAEELAAIDEVVSGVLAQAGAAPGDVDRVFATGGSSLVPAVRARLAARFGEAKVVGGDELTSVATGLALRARSLFA